MIVRISAASHTGKVRKRNEDMVLAGNIMFRDDTYATTVDLENRSVLFLAVADGMGGHQAGEVASEMVIHHMAKKIFHLPPSLSADDLRTLFDEWVQEIHRAIVEDGRLHQEREGMGTTLVGLLYYHRELFYVNVGDSRLYHMKDGRLTRLSRDHSLKEMTGQQEIPSNILANSIGAGVGVFTDFEALEPAVAPGEMFLLCSDGLHDMLDESQITERLSGGAVKGVEELLDRALANGGHDNISLIVMEIVSP